MYLYTKKNIVSLLIVLTLLTGCGGGGSSTTTDSTVYLDPIPERVGSCKFGSSQQQGQIKDITSGTGLADATITIDGCSTQTDSEGFYTLTDIAENEKAIVTIEYGNSYTHSTMITIEQYSKGTTDLSPNYLEYTIDNYTQQQNYSSETDKLIITSSNASIKLFASDYITMDQSNYIGTVSARIAYQDVSTDMGKEVFPGTFEGINDNGITIPFISYGFMVIDLKDTNGDQLDISQDATITFPSNVNSTKDTLALWYYDYDQGTWIEEGSAQRQPNGIYEGTIPHAGTWSLSEAIEAEPGIFRAQLLYESTQNPIRDARVSATGPNWVKKDLSTDDEGYFELEVMPGEDFKLAIYNYKWPNKAVLNGIIPAITSGDIVE